MVPHEEEFRRGLRRFDVGRRSFNGYEHNRLWRNTGRGGFVETGWAEGGDLVADSRAAAVADFDRDGRQDLAVRTYLGPSCLLRNDGPGGGFLRVELEGTRSNRMGVGARVIVETGSARLVRELACGSGFLSQGEPVLHFGLGDAARVDRLQVLWPSGAREEFRDLPAGRTVRVKEGEGIRIQGPPSRTPGPQGPLPPADRLRRLLEEGAFLDLQGRRIPAAPAPNLLLHVWSPACSSCSGEAATLQALRRLERKGDVEILAVAVDATPEQVRAFVEREGISYRVILADGGTSEELRASPDDAWGHPHRSFDGLITVEHAAPDRLPWSALLDPAGVRTWYRGPVKHFQAKQDLLILRAGR